VSAPMVEVALEPLQMQAEAANCERRTRSVLVQELKSSADKDANLQAAESTLQFIAARIKKQKARIKDELKGLRSRVAQSHAQAMRQHATPTLLSVEPLVSLCVDNGPQRVEYRAELELVTEGGRGHKWKTEPFSLDDLLAVVVSTRVAACSVWCKPRSGPSQAAVRLDRTQQSADVRRRGTCCVGWVFLCMAILAVWFCMRRVVRTIVVRWINAGDVPALGLIGVVLDFEWLVTLKVTALVVFFATGLFAGLAEISFLPAKAILQLERKDETAKVREQLQLLLNSGNPLQRMEVASFLNLGMATYYGSSETQKEGRCFCRRYESSDSYFSFERRRRCSILCCTFDWRFSQGRHRRLTERWLVLRKDGLCLFNSIMDQDADDMLFFDSSFSLFRDAEDRILVCGSSWLLELDFGEPSGACRGVAQSWCNAITMTAQLSPRTREQRFGSFAPVRYPASSKPGDRHMLRRSLARFLVGGRATFLKIAEALQVAEHEIFVAGWWITPHLPLVREGATSAKGTGPRLSALFRAAADRGVRVHVLIFHETMLPNDSEWAEAELQHPNLYVVRHRSRFDSNLLWSHHEKLVVVDQQLAFVGGIDMCLGRYDDARYRLSDEASLHTWSGQDYSNPRIRDFDNVRNISDSDILDRRHQPRMPWQDCHVQLLGRPARDVARHCIERWNHAKSRRPQYAGFPTVLLRRKVAVCNDRMLVLEAEEADSAWPPSIGAWCDCTSQVVRSACRWSVGTRKEASIHAAYCNLLQEAERFVYIENQFFCSGMDGDDAIGNRVVEALYLRVIRAHAHQENFHVMIVLPLLPALVGEITVGASSPLLAVMRWQYRTLRTLRRRLVDAGVTFNQYVSVYSLRTHGALSGAGLVSEQIYVHSKVMVVDDRYVVVGSANLNDRSLLGLRDSELNVVLRDTDTMEVMLGGPWQAGRLASGFRRALFARHLGWRPDEPQGDLADPLSRAALQEVGQLARRNTEIYEEVFGSLPSDAISTWSQLSARRAAGQPSGDITRVVTEDVERAAELLAQVRGHLVEFPLDFLVEEDLAPAARFSAGSLAPDAFN